MSTQEEKEQLSERADALHLVPRVDQLERTIARIVEGGDHLQTLDAETSQIAVEKLRHAYAKVYEVKNGQFKAAMGEVLPFVTDVPASADSYKYKTLEALGYMSWIGEDGSYSGTGSAIMAEHVGFVDKAGGEYTHTIFDLERAVATGLDLPGQDARNLKKRADAKQNWVALFGDPNKKILGLFTHPNIQVAMAPMSSSATHSDSRDRLIENKSVDEILADVETITETGPRSTLFEHRTGKVFMSGHDISVLKRRRVGAESQAMTIWQMIQSVFPEISFERLNECDEVNRVNPETQRNDSGVAGRCWIAVPVAPADECGFVFSRPLTQLAPQQDGFKLRVLAHAKFGGFKCLIPLAVVRMDFVARDNDTVPA